MEEMLQFVREQKSKCEFNGIDFEADLQSLYTETRRCMVTLYPDDFEPESVTEAEISIKDMAKEEYDDFKSVSDMEKSNVKKGYERVKEKIQNIRQDYSTAVNKGSRSGSGKIVKDNFNLLNEIWGGSPARNALPFGVNGEIVNEINEEDKKDYGMFYLICIYLFFGGGKFDICNYTSWICELG